MKNFELAVIRSWATTEGSKTSNDEFNQWLEYQRNNIYVNIEKTSIENTDWYYNSKNGFIQNESQSFFHISGIIEKEGNVKIQEQPIIVQSEIGMLAMICKEINGILNFLIQAKIEPGNINVIQLSPTVQATKSNFSQKHGGNVPPYFDYFRLESNYQLIYDQLQSEQSSRFFKKRNRNMVILVEEEIPVLSRYIWLTLGQIKKLMRLDNFVNADTRSVLSCLPLQKSYQEKYDNEIYDLFKDKSLFKSIYQPEENNCIKSMFSFINTFKMNSSHVIKLSQLLSLQNWSFLNNEFICNSGFPFKIIFCDIQISDREVKRWSQPLLEATTQGILGLIMCIDEFGEKQFLVHATHEIGCFDQIEFGPSIFLEDGTRFGDNSVETFFLKKIGDPTCIKYDVILSEEGGRFYHEQNRNIIIEVNKNELDIPKSYFWVNYQILIFLIQINNVLNIQLRNLLALIEV